MCNKMRRIVMMIIMAGSIMLLDPSVSNQFSSFAETLISTNSRVICTPMDDMCHTVYKTEFMPRRDVSKYAHLACDYDSITSNKTIYSFAEGDVIWVGEKEGWTDSGYFITIRHTIGNEVVYSRYQHMIKESGLVSVGDHVQCHTPIGVMGDSGGAYGAHLHFMLTTEDLPSYPLGNDEEFSQFGINEIIYRPFVQWRGIKFYNPDYVFACNGTCIGDGSINRVDDHTKIQFYQQEPVLQFEEWALVKGDGNRHSENAIPYSLNEYNQSLMTIHNPYTDKEFIVTGLYHNAYSDEDGANHLWWKTLDNTWVNSNDVYFVQGFPLINDYNWNLPIGDIQKAGFPLRGSIMCHNRIQRVEGQIRKTGYKEQTDNGWVDRSLEKPEVVQKKVQEYSADDAKYEVDIANTIIDQLAFGQLEESTYYSLDICVYCYCNNTAYTVSAFSKSSRFYVKGDNSPASGMEVIVTPAITYETGNPVEATTYTVVTTDGLNLRSAPNTSSDNIITTLWPGTTIIVTEKTTSEERTWGRGTTSNGYTGWCVVDNNWTVKGDIVSTDTQGPVIELISINDVSDQGYTVNCRVSDNVGVARVAFPTWTVQNEQDDLPSDWGESMLGNYNNEIASYRVNTSDHNNERGCYYRTHIYAWDVFGNQTMLGLDDVYVPAQIIEATSITLDRTNLVLGLNSTYTLKATILPENATYQDIDWYVSDPSVATVIDGVITTKAVGTVSVVARLTGNLYTRCGLTVKELSEDIDYYNGFTIKGYTITEYSGNDLSITIPSMINGRPVYMIGSYVFSGSNITSVSISEGITTIRNGAFKNCKNLREVNLPESLSYVGEDAFRECISLEEIGIPEKCGLSNGAFHTCTSLQRIVLPDGTKSVPNFCFMGCTSLEEVVLPSTVQNIYGQAFQGCTALQTINIPDGVLSLGNYAFCACTYLSTLDVPRSVESITNYTFINCSNLKLRVYYDSYIYRRAKALEIPYEFIDQDDCVGVERIELDQNRININLLNKGTITISATIYPSNATIQTVEWVSKDPSVAIISGNGVVKAKGVGSTELVCTSLDGEFAEETIQAVCSITVYEGIDSITIIEPSVELVLNTEYQLSTIVEPEGYSDYIVMWEVDDPSIATITDTGVISFKRYGFVTVTADVKDSFAEESSLVIGCEPQDEIFLPAGLMLIDEEAFSGSGFEAVIIPDGVEVIGKKAFANCRNLCKVIIPASVKEIAADAFEDSPYVTIITSIDTDAAKYARNHGIRIKSEDVP